VDLLHLEHFLAVAEEGSFTRAAERVCRSQPAVSQSVKKLEEEIGTPLFARDTPELSLTSAGKMLLDSARRMVQLRNEAMRQLGDLRRLGCGSLSITAHESAAVYLLPGPLREYLQRFPNVRVGIYRSRLEDIPRQVMDREVDMGFVKDACAFHEVRSVLVHLDELILIASPRHPLATRGHVRVKDLDREPFIVHHLCSDTEQKIRRLFEANGTHWNIGAELWSFENVKDFVQRDVGVAIVPRITVERELAAGSLVEIPVKELNIPRRTMMVFRDQDYMSDTARQFVELVRTSGTNHLPSKPAEADRDIVVSLA
jgi:DNA-binding transcriptional LysR family regulator